MNFEPDNILTPDQGNNGNARSVSVRVMNDREPTPAQLAELRHIFEEHRKALSRSLAGFLVKDSQFADGTRSRIVSNSGQHTIQIWPAGGEQTESDEPIRLLSIPADQTATYGWTSPLTDGGGNPINGGLGTVATSGTMGDAGVIAALRKDPTTHLIDYSTKLLRAVTASGNSSLNANPISNSTPNYSAQGVYRREWISPDAKTCVSCDGNVVRVNGASKGSPAPTVYPNVFFAAVFKQDGEKKLFALCLDNVHTMRFFVRPLAGGSGVGWTGLASYNVLTKYPSLSTTADQTHLPKHACMNESGTVVTCWLQAGNPQEDGLEWVGMIDVDTSNGAVTHVDATRPAASISRTDPARTDGLGSTCSFSATGTFQIAVDYDGDTKVFTEVETTLSYSDARTSTTSPASGTQTVAVDRTTTLSITSVFKYKTFEKTLLDVEFSYVHSKDTSYNDNGGDPDSGSASLSTTASATVSGARMWYWGRDLFVYEEIAPWTWEYSESLSGSFPSYTISGDEEKSAISKTLKLERLGRAAQTLLSYTIAGSSSSGAVGGISLTGYATPPTQSAFSVSNSGELPHRLMVFANPFASSELSSASIPLVDPASSTNLLAGTAFFPNKNYDSFTSQSGMGDVGLGETPVFRQAQQTGIPQFMNERSVMDFSMASFRTPELTTLSSYLFRSRVGFATTQYTNYCTHTGLLPKYLSTGTGFVLKNLKFI
jgi:hypothetical protein